MPADWRSVIPLSELTEGEGKLVRVGDKKIALFRVGDRVFATDNQCPHEGYPLAEGSIQDGILTCNWHNWKFELDGGRCVFGGEDVAVYATEIRNDEVYVNVEDPPAAVAVPKRRQSLVAAIEEMDTPRMARDIVRLLEMDTDPNEILFDAAAHGAERAEYGWNHALAVVTDCARMLPGLDHLDRALPVTQACRAVSEENLRLPPRPHPGPVSIEGFASLDEAFLALRDAVEKGRLEKAESLFRGAVASGIPRADLERWLYTLATDHFLSFGHALIYVTKAFEMLDVLGDRVLAEVFPAILPEIHYATREDLLPYMRSFMSSLHDVLPELASQASRQGKPDAEFDPSGLRRAMQDGTQQETFAATYDALDRGVPVDAILDTAVLAASERILRFDPDKDRLVDKDFGWLDVTHNLTYANAVRKAYRTVPGPETLRAVYFATWFVNRTKKLDVPNASGGLDGSPARTNVGEPSEAAVRRAIADHDLGNAVAAAGGFAGKPESVERLGRLLVGMSLEDQAGVQIFVDHLIKTSMAAAEESARLAGHREACSPLLATARFFAADRRERTVPRQVRLAIDFVTRGKPSETA